MGQPIRFPSNTWTKAPPASLKREKSERSSNPSFFAISMLSPPEVIV
jgi:hypothetical protein